MKVFSASGVDSSGVCGSLRCCLSLTYNQCLSFQGVVCVFSPSQTGTPGWKWFLQCSEFFIYIFVLLRQIRREYRKFFRANAGRKIYDFIIQRIVSIISNCCFGFFNDV